MKIDKHWEKRRDWLQRVRPVVINTKSYEQKKYVPLRKSPKKATGKDPKKIRLQEGVRGKGQKQKNGSFEFIKISARVAGRQEKHRIGNGESRVGKRRCT